MPEHSEGRMTIYRPQGKEIIYPAEQVRKRKSYQFWKELHDWLSQPRTTEEIMHHINAILNDKMAFGSSNMAFFAQESLLQFLEDLKEQ